MMADLPKSGVLIVEDDSKLRELLQMWLEPEYDVHTAADGKEALEIVSPAIDVVLLDRNLPKVAGADVLQEIRAQGLDCKVSMLTAVDPGTEILEMPFDEYLVKPVDKQELRRTVDELQARSEYITLMDRYFELTTKLSVIEQSPDSTAIKDDSAYQQLEAEHQEIADELTRRQSTLLEAGKYETLFAEMGAP